MSGAEKAQRDGAARLVSAGAAMLSASVLLDSAMEHYRGSFRNKAMWLPLLSSAANLGVDGSGRGGGLRLVSHAAAGGIGSTGFGFHAWNVAKRPGGVRLVNLFYGAPIGAPGALVLAGAVGAVADGIRADPPRIGPLPLGDGRALAGLLAFGIAGTVGEAGLLHFRGAFQNPAMYLPVVLPPVAALSLARDAWTGEPRGLTVGLLVATAVMGIAGVAFHAYGVGRNMGGWRNASQNLLAGPPLPAPPSFTGLAVAALGALRLMRGRDG
ncbi:hypothetical protein [Sphingomonas sp.]|uniref:hypothetical protein n=1 Tax=Sphingomonas sp. TaxID=28214 RepID=UPI003AFFE4CE